MLDALRDIPIVGDVRGAGYFHAIELVKDRETKESFAPEESETLLRGFLSGELFKRGLICRADDRGDPVVQLSPPLIAGPEDFAEIESVLRPVLEEATERMNVGAQGVGMLTVRELLRELDVRPAPRGGRARRAGALGPHLRAARSDALALGRRAAADHGHAARHGQAPARVRGAAGRSPARRASGWGRDSPTTPFPRR